MLRGLQQEVRRTSICPWARARGREDAAGPQGIIAPIAAPCHTQIWQSYSGSFPPSRSWIMEGETSSSVLCVKIKWHKIGCLNLSLCDTFMGNLTWRQHYFLIIWTACVVFWNYLNLFGVTCCSYITFDSFKTSGLTRPIETDFTVNHGAELSVKSPAVNSIWNQKPVALEWTSKNGDGLTEALSIFIECFWIT